MRLDELNALDADVAAREFLRCCGSTRWARMMAAARPFDSAEAMAVTADVIWSALAPSDWQEGFAAHPQIGAARAEGAGGAGGAVRAGGAGRAGGAVESDWSAQEQSGVTDDSRARFAQLNRAYHERFGYTFIVCATGKTAAEMLRTLEQRMGNNPHDELRAAADEQRQITRLRLGKLLT